MMKTYFKNFAIYLSDYLSFTLFLFTMIFVVYFLLFDTSYLASLGVFENEFILATVCAIASLEICGLFLSYNYFKLKKMIYFSRIDKFIDLNVLTRFVCLRIISALVRLVSLLVFFSPFLLSLSGIFYLTENGISENVLFIVCMGSASLFIMSILSYSVFIQKLTFLYYDFIKAPYMNFKSLFKLSDENSDGNLFILFKLKLRNLPKKVISVFLFPAIYYLPSCLFDVYDFLYEKENPYPHKVNTEKTVVFYFEPIKDF